jgi:monothiol glutaredoxin
MDTTTDTLSVIKSQIGNHAVLLYMKGSPQFPQCGFSARVAHILGGLNTQYAYVNILEHPKIRATLPGYAKWPTFPQLYIQGELIGGCDIISALNEKGELKSLLEVANALSELQPNIVSAA